MAHILVFQDDPAIACIIAETCEEEGHLVTKASTVEDTLMILRTSLHPLIVIAERDHSSQHPDGPFFVTIRDHPEFYAQHRYIAIHYWKLTEEENTLMNELGVPLVRGPFDVDHLLALVDTAAASLAQGSL